MFLISFPSVRIQGNFMSVPGHLASRLRLTGPAWALLGFQPQNHYLVRWLLYASVSYFLKWRENAYITRLSGRLNKMTSVNLLICAWDIANSQQVLKTVFISNWKSTWHLLKCISPMHGKNSQLYIEKYLMFWDSQASLIGWYLRLLSALLGSSPRAQVIWELIFACYSGASFQPQLCHINI